MSKYLSKEAKRLTQLRFSEKQPVQIQYTPQRKTWTQDWTTIERENLQILLENEDFQYIKSGDEYIVAYFSKTETKEEYQQRIAKQQAELDAYEQRKNMFYAQISKQIQEAEKIEKLRREKFDNPEYIELLRLKKKFGE